MPGSYKAECLVLAKTKLGETDAVLTLLSSEGRQIRAVGKGVRRPGNRFGARLEPYSQVQLQLHNGRNLDVVSDARTVNANAACREDLDRSGACAVVAELLLRATREAHVEPRVYELTAAAFSAIGAAAPEQAPLFAAAQLVKAFAMMGVRPALRECALCGQPAGDGAFFDLSAGGVLCAECSGGLAAATDADARLVQWVDALLHATFAELAEYDTAPVRPLLDFCERWAVEHLQLRLKSMGFLRTLI